MRHYNGENQDGDTVWIWCDHCDIHSNESKIDRYFAVRRGKIICLIEDAE